MSNLTRQRDILEIKVGAKLGAIFIVFLPDFINLIRQLLLDVLKLVMFVVKISQGEH
jgi:hypothetical protein